jgi:hypothetical protein
MGKTSENDDWSKDFGDFSVLFWLLLKPKKSHLIPEIAKGTVNSGKRLPGTAPSSSSR